MYSSEPLLDQLQLLSSRTNVQNILLSFTRIKELSLCQIQLLCWSYFQMYNHRKLSFDHYNLQHWLSSGNKLLLKVWSYLLNTSKYHHRTSVNWSPNTENYWKNQNTVYLTTCRWTWRPETWLKKALGMVSGPRKYIPRIAIRTKYFQQNSTDVQYALKVKNINLPN